MSDPIALSDATYDRFDRAARAFESVRPHQRLSIPNQSPILQYLKVVAGSANDNGYPAYIQKTDDAGETWTDLTTTVVRVSNGGTLAEDDLVHVRFAGMNSDGEACFIVVGGGASVADKCWYFSDDSSSIVNIAIALSGNYRVELSSYAYEETSGDADAITLPSTGLWEFHGYVTGTATYSGTTTSGGITIGVTNNSTNADMIMPNGGGLGLYACDTTDRTKATGTATFSCVLNVTTANANALSIYAGVVVGGGTATAATVLTNANVFCGNAPLSAPYGCFLRARKIS